MTEKKLEGVADIDGELKTCSGIIRIFNFDLANNVAYVSWEMFDQEKKSIAFRARHYKVTDKSNVDERIIELAIENILSYRIGCKVIFSEITN